MGSSNVLIFPIVAASRVEWCSGSGMKHKLHTFLMGHIVVV
jgi:hypothetical protein